MHNIQPIDPKNATGETKDAFDEAVVQFGGVINLFRMAGHAPNVLRSFKLSNFVNATKNESCIISSASKQSFTILKAILYIAL